MNILRSDSPAVVTGFLYGFIDSMTSNSKSLDSPLSSVVSAGINGIIYGSLAGFVSAIVLPGVSKPLLPAILVLSAYKKHSHLLPNFIADVKVGTNNAVNDVVENGSNKLNEFKKDVSNVFNK